MEDRDIERTKSNIAALVQLLEQEFEALKGQIFDVFEKYPGPRKSTPNAKKIVGNRPKTNKKSPKNQKNRQKS